MCILAQDPLNTGVRASETVDNHVPSKSRAIQEDGKVGRRQALVGIPDEDDLEPPDAKPATGQATRGRGCQDLARGFLAEAGSHGHVLCILLRVLLPRSRPLSSYPARSPVEITLLVGVKRSPGGSHQSKVTCFGRVDLQNPPRHGKRAGLGNWSNRQRCIQGTEHQASFSPGVPLFPVTVVMHELQGLSRYF